MIALHNGIMMSMMQGLSEADASEIFEAGIRNILKNSSLYKN
jgi:hypothetical protein